jgi:hypothetical protein
MIGTALDGIHAYGDVLSYSDPGPGRWAWYVPIQFGRLAVVVALATPALERLGGSAPVGWSSARVAAELALFAALYAATALLDDHTLLLTVGLPAIALLRLAVGGAAGDWPYVLLGAALGPAGEAIVSSLGGFEYANPDFAGVPAWLPGLWANGGFLIRRLIAPLAMRPRPSMPVRRTGAGRS